MAPFGRPLSLRSTTMATVLVAAAAVLLFAGESAADLGLGCNCADVLVDAGSLQDLVDVQAAQLASQKLTFRASLRRMMKNSDTIEELTALLLRLTNPTTVRPITTTTTTTTTTSTTSTTIEETTPATTLDTTTTTLTTTTTTTTTAWALLVVDYAVCTSPGCNTLAGASATSDIPSGKLNTITDAEWSVVAGGILNGLWGNLASVGGGMTNTANGEHAVVAGGFNNVAKGQYTANMGGQTQKVWSNYAAVAGGYKNLVAGRFSAIVGSGGSQVSGHHSLVVGSLSTVKADSSVGFGFMAGECEVLDHNTVQLCSRWVRDARGFAVVCVRGAE
jgi:hypothetical protein